MKKVLFTLVLCFVLINCSDETDSNQLVYSYGDEIQSTLLADYLIPDKDIDLLQQLGFSGSPVQVYEKYNLLTEESYVNYLVEGDINIKAEDLINMVPLEHTSKVSSKKQYRTSIVADPATYKIMYVSYSIQTPWSNELTITTDPDISAALDLAITNYNNLNLGISFERDYLPTSYPYATRAPALIRAANNYINDSGAIIIRHTNTGSSGSAGFPRRVYELRSGFSNVPYKEIDINLGVTSAGLDILEHVLTHEMGHCIGLRHTDYARRSVNCPADSRFGNEGASSYGAIHIPGTPTANEWGATGLDTDSIMISCGNGFEDGEFSTHDITALRAIW